MNWWFWASQHRVKIVLIIKLDRSTHTVLIEKYTAEAISVPRPGATGTGSSTRFGLKDIVLWRP